MLAVSTLKKNPALGELVIPRPLLTLPTNVGIRAEPDRRYKDFLSAWADYNRTMGQTREWMLKGFDVARPDRGRHSRRSAVLTRDVCVGLRGAEAYWGLIWQGLGVTVLYTVITVVAGLAIGLLTGILRTMGPRWVWIPVRGYIEVFRCTPLLVQLVWVYYALPVLIGVDMSATTACFLTLSLYAGRSTRRFFGAASRRSIAASGRPARPSACGEQDFPPHRIAAGHPVMVPAFINQTIMQLKNTRWFPPSQSATCSIRVR